MWRGPMTNTLATGGRGRRTATILRLGMIPWCIEAGRWKYCRLAGKEALGRIGGFCTQACDGGDSGTRSDSDMRAFQLSYPTTAVIHKYMDKATPTTRRHARPFFDALRGARPIGRASKATGPDYPRSRVRSNRGSIITGSTRRGQVGEKINPAKTPKDAFHPHLDPAGRRRPRASRRYECMEGKN